MHKSHSKALPVVESYKSRSIVTKKISINQAALKYENFIIMSDFNFDIQTLLVLGKINLKNSAICFIIPTWFMAVLATILWFLQTDHFHFRRRVLQRSVLVIIISVFQVFSRLKPKLVNYRNYENFNDLTFLKEIFSTGSDPNERYSHLTDTFLKVVNK